jgi:hypothetical protein
MILVTTNVTFGIEWFYFALSALRVISVLVPGALPQALTVRAFSACGIILLAYLGRCPRLLHCALLALESRRPYWAGRSRLLHSAPSALERMNASICHRRLAAS